jgi:hypothetical protein
MTAYKGICRIDTIILNQALDGGEWLNSRSGRFTTGKTLITIE